MFVALTDHNDAARLAMGRLEHQVIQAWRFRHHRSAAGRALCAAWMGVKGLVHKALSAKGPSIAPARKRLSY